jgi:hypothetical protein
MNFVFFEANMDLVNAELVFSNQVVRNRQRKDTQSEEPFILKGRVI